MVIPVSVCIGVCVGYSSLYGYNLKYCQHTKPVYCEQNTIIDALMENVGI